MKQSSIERSDYQGTTASFEFYSMATTMHRNFICTRHLLTFASLLIVIVNIEGFSRSFPSHTEAKECLTMRLTDQVPRTSSDSFNGFAKKLNIATALILPVIAFSRRADAALFSSAEQTSIDTLSRFQKPVFELLDQLRPGKSQVLKGGIEDSNVVQQYLNIYIVPLQAKMAEVATTLKLDQSADQSRIEILPLLMKGHILELTQAIKELKADKQAKEVAEVQETLDEYLKLASSKYTVSTFVPSKPYTDLQFFGPFGCEYYGKKRVEGTNVCELIPTEKSS